MEALLNPEISGTKWVQMWRDRHIDVETLQANLDTAGASLYLFEAVICLVGRWCYTMVTPYNKRLYCFSPWRAPGILDVDWNAWGDFLFLVGAMNDVICEFYTISFGTVFSDVCWTLNGLLCLIGSIRPAKETWSVQT